jgi:hypothetical protein
MLRDGLLTTTTASLILAMAAGSSGCGDGKPEDGTLVKGAAPLSDEQKAVHRKFYDPEKRAANNKAAGKRA